VLLCCGRRRCRCCADSLRKIGGAGLYPDRQTPRALFTGRLLPRTDRLCLSLPKPAGSIAMIVDATALAEQVADDVVMSRSGLAGQALLCAAIAVRAGDLCRFRSLEHDQKGCARNFKPSAIRRTLDPTSARSRLKPPARHAERPHIATISKTPKG